jgi:hypothetical protein
MVVNICGGDEKKRGKNEFLVFVDCFKNKKVYQLLIVLCMFDHNQMGMLVEWKKRMIKLVVYLYMNVLNLLSACAIAT